MSLFLLESSTVAIAVFSVGQLRACSIFYIVLLLYIQT